MRALVTGSAGLVGSAITRLLLSKGWQVAGVDNDYRASMFGAKASTSPVRKELCKLPGYRHSEVDVRSDHGMNDLMAVVKPSFIVHAAGAPSHDWAAKNPRKDWEVNAIGTMNVLLAMRKYVPEARLAFLSTNKVYGNAPGNYRLPVNESVPIDQTTHSLFGASKLAADVMTQEFGRYYGHSTAVFRCGCITGAAHKAVVSHGFLAYLVKCARLHTKYTIYGYGGKQVRDQLHAADLAELLWQFYENPCAPGEVFNVGGGFDNAISILKAIEWLKRHGYELQYQIEETPRKGDHICYYTDLSKVQRQWPSWKVTKSLDDIMEELLQCSTSTH